MRTVITMQVGKYIHSICETLQVPMSITDNLSVYNKPDVVKYYSASRELFPAEKYIFVKYKPVDGDVLDVGVGGGRTSPHLADHARRYLGIDYSTAMIDTCRARFPRLQFAVANATDLNQIDDESFDLTVFSFNGIDYLSSDAERLACLRELARVTRKGGWVIFSSHNARAVGSFPELRQATYTQRIWRSLRAIALVLRGLVHRLPNRAFWQGTGYVMDPVHGGLLTHVSTPRTVELECRLADLKIVESVGHFYPLAVPQWLNPWTYYVAQRTD